MRTSLAVVAVSLLATLPLTNACASGTQPSRKVTSTREGKPSAPVDVTATLEADRAKVEVAFLANATDVQVRVHGIDGLVLTSPGTPITGTFNKGQSANMLVTFTPPAGQANLVVTVSGVFNGARGAKTATFTVGQPTQGALKVSPNVKVEPNGDRVIEAPGQVR